MDPKEEEQLRIEERIRQEEPPSPTKRLIIGIIGVTILLTLPMILDWASGGKARALLG